MSIQYSLDLVPPEHALIQLWTPDEIYDRLSAENVHRFAEDRRIERKSASVQPKAMADYLSMWSNTQPHGGIVIVGVEDNGEVTGCARMSDSHRNDIETLTHLCTDARWVHKNISVRNNKGEDDFIIVFRVSYRADKLVETSAGEAFIREGSRKVRMTEPLKREIRIAKGEIHYELEPVSLRFPADFDTSEIDNFCRTFFTNRRYQTTKCREELLELAKLGRRESSGFKPNLACTLLFAKDPRDVIPGARIRIIRYEGTQEHFGQQMNSVFSTFVDGNVARLLAEAKPLIAAQLRTFQRYGQRGRIELKHEYPEEAWFEALVNAVAHRSYNLKTQNIFVKIFDDRMVVESPGGFVPPTTAETVYEAHNPRNPYLMEAMMHLELTFCGFEGTRRMRAAMQSAKLPAPRFRQIEANSHQVHVTLENDAAARRAFVAHSTFSRVSEDEFMEMSKEERQIVNYLANNADLNITHAALLTGRSWPTVNRVITGLVEKGVIELTDEASKRRHASNRRYRLKDGRAAD